ncbi:MAG: ABC transporter substrate-binding protein, partial [Microvirga sp.]
MKSHLKSIATACALSLLAGTAFAQALKPLNSDTETDRMSWSELQSKLGEVPKAPAGTQVGGVSKTLTNEYWRALGEGYAAYGKKAGVPVVYQAAQ